MLLTTTTDVLTASDTLCLSSAAVPGLLSLLVNLRTSDMLGTLHGEQCLQLSLGNPRHDLKSRCDRDRDRCSAAKGAKLLRGGAPPTRGLPDRQKKLSINIILKKK